MRYLVLIFLLLCITARSQDFSYVHYDARDGLPSKRVYAMCQDRQGFMWFSTDNGICRFDGQNFRTFSTDDGLPDNDIINIFCDDQNRIWLHPYRKDIAFCQHGKIHNRLNDSLLKQLSLSAMLRQVFDDHNGHTWIITDRDISLINPDNSITRISNGSPDELPVYGFADAGKNVWIYLNIKDGTAYHKTVLRKYQNGKAVSESGLDKLIFRNLNHFAGMDHLTGFPVADNEIDLQLKAPVAISRQLKRPNLISVYPLSDSTLMLNKGDGAELYNLISDKTIRYFLKGKTVNRCFRDDEGNIWFSTLDEGVYKLNANAILMLNFADQFGDNPEVYSVTRFNNTILAGLSRSTFASVNRQNYQVNYHSFSPVKTFDRVLEIIPVSENEFICRSDKSFARFTKSLQLSSRFVSPIKSVYINGPYTYSGTFEDTRRWLNNHPEKPEIISKERATAIIEKNDSVYIGTLEELFLLTPSKQLIRMGDRIPAVKDKITALYYAADGVLWVLTYNSGVVAIKDNKLMAHITTRNGLTSNNCHTAFLTDSVLWVGTEKGLNKVMLHKAGFPVTRFTVSDGLPDNVINAVFADSNLVYIGTPSGLSWFDEKNIFSHSRCRIVTENIMADTVQLEPGLASYHLSYRQRNVSFHFRAISLQVAGNIVYTYRLHGLNENWQQTGSETVNFISLPSGSYRFEIYASNRAGISSPVLRIDFTIDQPFWQADWFKALLVAAGIVLIALLFRWQLRRFQRKEREKNQIRQQLFELEQKAKKAQMNPHFIFNCISAIQNFVFTSDVEASNRYISGFAQLIRQTLDNSDKPVVALSEEIRYLQTYLSLEQMRFSGKFSFLIECDPGIYTDYTYLPPMLLQPFIENSIRHGIAYRRDHTGFIRVHFMKTENFLVCTITDNGVGRVKAEQLKSSMHIEFQSKGMSLTQDRLEAIGRFFGKQILLEISDIVDASGEVAGTRVELKFPLELLEKIS